jgi:hypothetical protein
MAQKYKPKSKNLTKKFIKRQKKYDHDTYKSPLGIILNEEFASLLSKIETQYIMLPKAFKIRVERWVSKLSAPMPTLAWRRNR